MAHARALGRLLVNEPRLPLDEPLGKLDSLIRMTLRGDPSEDFGMSAVRQVNRDLVQVQRPRTGQGAYS